MFVSVSVDVLDPDEQEPNDWDILKLGGVGQSTVLLSVTVCNVAPVFDVVGEAYILHITCLLYTSPSPRDLYRSRMPSSA